MVVGEFTQETDLVVIGAGPGGCTAAFRAAELGVQSLIVDLNDSLGGACLHHGCIPCKTLLSIGDAIHLAKRAAQFGVQFAEPKVDLAKVRQWTQLTIDALAAKLAKVCKEREIELVKGAARFENDRTLVVHNDGISRIRFKRAVIATGSSPLPPPGNWPQSPHIMDSTAALRLEQLPKTLLVIGCGSIALELASLHAAFGSKVTLVSEHEQLLAGVEPDPDLVRPVAERLRETLADVCLDTTITDMRAVPQGLEVSYSGDRTPEQRTFDRILIAIGRAPNTSNLDLLKAQVPLDDGGYVRVDDQLRTSNQRIFAVGDVTGNPLLADKAMHQARVAAEVIAGWDSVFDARALPFVVFTDPQIAWCGLTETQAKTAGIPHRVSKIPWGGSGRAVSVGRTDGITKLIIDPDTKLLLGMGIVGSGAAELISQGVLALEMGAVDTDLASTVHPYPTLGELIGEAARTSQTQFDSKVRPKTAG